jgi:hypothetical protein
VKIRIVDLIRGGNQKAEGYSQALQAARVRAAHERSYFAPALFSLVPVRTDLIGSMAVDAQWRLYYNDAWLATHSVEQNATLLIHEVSHLLRDHEGRRKAAGIKNYLRWNTAGDCEINDDLDAEGLPLPGDPPLPVKYGLPRGSAAEIYYKELSVSSGADRERSRRRGAGLRIGRARRASILGIAGRRWERGRHPGSRSAQIGARPARGGAADRRDIALLNRRVAGLAAMGTSHAGAQSRLHGDDPPHRAAGAAGQHAREVRSDVPATASPAGVLRRPPHAQLLPAAAPAGISDRHLGLDGRVAAVASRRGAWRFDPSTRLWRGRAGRVLRLGGAQCEARVFGGTR